MPRTSTASWDSRALGDLFDMQLGKMLSASKRVGSRQRPYVANRNVQWNRIDLTDVETMHFSAPEDGTYGLRNGDLLVCEGGEIGRTAIWANELDDCHFQNAVHRLRPNDGSIVPRYFLHFMRFAADHGLFRRLSGQTSIAHLTKEGLRQLVIPVPSVSEQSNIVEILDTVDDAMRTTEHLIAKLEDVNRGLLHDLLTRGIDEQGKVRDPSARPDEFVRTTQGVIHESWSIDLLGSIGRISSGTTPLRGHSRYWVGGSIPWVKTGEVSFNEILGTEEYVTPAALSDTSLRLLPVGTILIAMYGEGVTRGRCAVLGVPATTNQACAAFEPDRGRVTSRFLFHYLQWQYETIRELGQGSNQTNLSGALLRNMTVVVPPLREQERIVDEFDAVALRIRREESSLQKFRTLKAGLMEDLLTGRVRVSVDEDAA